MGSLSQADPLAENGRCEAIQHDRDQVELTKDLRDRVVVKLQAIQRLVMWHVLSGPLKLYLVAEYPKSGGSWLAQMLAEYLRVPFPRNARPRLESSIMHGHHLYSPRFRNALYLLRDGRDCMVSEYYHRLIPNTRSAKRMWATREIRRRLRFADVYDIKANLPRFIEYMFSQHTRRTGDFLHLRFTWTQFVDSWLGKGVPQLRYEDLLTNAPKAMAPALIQLTGEPVDMTRLSAIEEKFSFENLSGRNAGQEDLRSFLRKGVAGDWKNHFTEEARQTFDYFAGRALISAGYEEDSSWASRTAAR